MAIFNQINCDNCSRVLVGAYKAEQISRSYLEIKGFVREWVVDEHSAWREPNFITRHDGDELAFCVEEDDGSPRDCFGEFRETRKRFHDEVRKRRLQAEASDSLAHGDARHM